MNAVEIEQAVSTLAEEPFDPGEFPFAFLEAFGNKPTTIKRLRAGTTNGSDVGGVLQRNNIHIKVAPRDRAAADLTALRTSPETSRARAKFVLATDGREVQAEEIATGEVLVCDYTELPDHFGFFLPLAGITTVKEIRESAIDIKATGRLNRLYVELLKQNPEWEGADQRRAMNQFMARLIFCFFAEDTDIFSGDAQFTSTVEQMTAPDGSNMDSVLGELFRAMNTHQDELTAASLPRWAEPFPYVNGGLFSEVGDIPRFSRIARSYLIHIGNLDWKKINPDIFGSMVQAIAVKEERGNLGMHYTSVPNILKVLNPLFLDDLRRALDDAGDNGRKLLNLRKRLARIRVFDPACGSGNFLVIAYQQMRAIEAEINRRRGESVRRSSIPISNFRGIEISDFSAEIARLALVIAEYQCNVRYLGQREALAVVLPLDEANWITCANALRVDWTTVCPPSGNEVEIRSDGLLEPPMDQRGVDFENEGGETYICGNPPYQGSQSQTSEQKADLKHVFFGRTNQWRSLDYVAGWFLKAADFGTNACVSSAFVATNSVCQGRQVATLWPLIFETGHSIAFAHTGFKWSNLASHNAGVVVSIVGISCMSPSPCRLYSEATGMDTTVREVEFINPYLIAGQGVIVHPRRTPLADLPTIRFGNMPNDGGHLLLSRNDVKLLGLTREQRAKFIRPVLGSREFIHGESRYCLWIADSDYDEACAIPAIRDRVESVRKHRLSSRDKGTNKLARKPHQFREMHVGNQPTVIIPCVSSENRSHLPVGFLEPDTIVTNLAFALLDAPVWHVAVVASRLHLVWIATVCGRLGTGFRYSKTIGWNTFPVPKLTTKNREALTVCAENILLAREAHFPATIADLYAPGQMPDNLRAAHERNDEVLERIYIGRRFKNDTERLEKLFQMYTKMVDQL